MDAVKYQAILNETSETEALQEIICKLCTSAAETAKPDNEQTYYDNSSRANASSDAAQNEMKSEKAEAVRRAFKDYHYRVQCERNPPEVLIHSEYIYNIKACETFSLSVSKDNYPQTRQNC